MSCAPDLDAPSNLTAEPSGLSREVRIALLGPYGFGNLGDAAIQDAAISHIRALVPRSKIYGISLNVADTESRHGVIAFPINALAMRRSSPVRIQRFLDWQSRIVLVRAAKKLLASLVDVWFQLVFLGKSLAFVRKLDVLVVSGGGQIDDYWGGPWRHPFSLFTWSLLTKLCRRKLVCLSIGGWELKSRLSRVFVRTSLSLSDYRSYRDSLSKEFAESIRVPAPNYVFPDLAFSYPIRLQRRAGRSDCERFVVGISPIAADAWTSPTDPVYEEYLNQLVALARHLLEDGYQVRMIHSQLRMDLPVASELCRRIGNLCCEAALARLTQVSVQGVEDFLAAAHGVDFMIASRLHGVLLSLVATTPVVAISYHRKVDLLMEEFGLSRFSVDIADLKAGVLNGCLDDLIADKVNVVEQIRTKTLACREALQSQYVQVFAGLASAGCPASL